MNALQASELLERIRKKVIALERVIHYLEDEYEWRDDVDELIVLLESLKTEYLELSARLEGVLV